MAFRETYLEIISGQRRDFFAGCGRCVLTCFESIYLFGTTIRNFAFDRGWRTVHDVGVPVISVGNLTTGGTGKTPIVATVVRMLQQHGRSPGIVSRGYHADDTGSNDEKKVLARLCAEVPHLQDPDRVAAVRRIIDEFQVNAVVLDDGLQHRRLGRNLNIVLVDVTNPFGYDHILPRGLLRESVTGLRRADLILMTRCDQVSDEELHAVETRIRNIAPGYDHRPVHITFRADNLLDTGDTTLPVDHVNGQCVMVATAIGNPDGFVETCRSIGASVICEEFFPDHHHYTSTDVESIISNAERHQVDAVLTTVKDMVKIQTLHTLENAASGPPIYAVEISAAFDSSDAEQTMLATIEQALTLNSSMKD